MTEQPDRNQNRPSASSHSGHSWWIAIVAALIVAFIVVASILPRVTARAKLKSETEELAQPTVAVVHPKNSAPAHELVLPANVQAYRDAPIYARTNGYLKKWYVDLGARVKTGQLLAEIDTPEVNQQSQQARADLATAQANLHLAEITTERYQGLLQTDAVSKQEADNAAGDFAAKKAIVDSAQYNVKRLQELQSFQKIYAPFDGTITARNTDIGALIDSGASGGTRTELFHMVSSGKLRVYVNVPEEYSRVTKPGLKADLVLAEFPGRRFPGTLVRTADAIDSRTRTLLVEIEVDNPTNELFSGSYAEVHMKLAGAVSSFTLPVNTLLFRSEGLRVAAVNPDKKVSLLPITIGHDYGTEVEVVAGLKGGETVVVNPPDSLIEGQVVRIASSAVAGE